MFFRKYDTSISAKKSRKHTLDLIVVNNLLLSIVKSLSFRAFVSAYNP